MRAIAPAPSMCALSITADSRANAGEIAEPKASASAATAARRFIGIRALRWLLVPGVWAGVSARRDEGDAQRSEQKDREEGPNERFECDFPYGQPAFWLRLLFLANGSSALHEFSARAS